MSLHDLIVIEGPAGSGKSHLVNELAARYDIGKLQRHYKTIKRDWGINAPFSSMVKDYTLLMSAITLFNLDYRPLVVDRLFLSQAVYQRLRNIQIYHDLEKDSFDYLTFLYSYLVTICSSLELFKNQYSLRFFRRTQETLDIRITFVVLCPSEGYLSLCRSNTGKIYPFPAELELRFYKGMAMDIQSFVQNDVLIGHSGKIRCFPIYLEAPFHPSLAFEVYEKIGPI